MAKEKQIKSRIINKHDVEANWDKAVNFIPEKGEIIVYDIDNNYNYERIKVGDGETTVITLPFLTDNVPQESSIIDVVELPTEDINEDVFYRLITGTFVCNQYLLNGYTCYCVESLPEVGEPVTDTTMSIIVAYYNTQDGSVKGYVDDILSAALGIPVAWYDLAVLLSLVNQTFGGIITNILDDPRNGTLYLFLEYVICSYKSDKWTIHKTIGWAGAGANAEVFNHPSNKAYGHASHAEGLFTVAGEEGIVSYGAHAEGVETLASADASHAEGNSSHAEGYYSHAEGDSSHAEGNSSHAEGYYSHAQGASSHAEGNSSYAEGDSSHAEGTSSHAEGGSSHAEGYSSHAEGGYSHAEGGSSHAEGDGSHAEGYSSHAVGRSQHAQGEFNITDPEYNAETPNERAKYAHIVGNGISDSNRSNAHTLDWNGLGWFAGGLKVGGTGQDDSNAEEILTESQVQTLIDEAVPTKTSDLENDSGYITSVPSEYVTETELTAKLTSGGYLTSESDPTVPTWAKAATKPSYTANEVGAYTKAEIDEIIAQKSQVQIITWGADD